MRLILYTLLRLAGGCSEDLPLIALLLGPLIAFLLALAWTFGVGLGTLLVPVVVRKPDRSRNLPKGNLRRPAHCISGPKCKV